MPLPPSLNARDCSQTPHGGALLFTFTGACRYHPGYKIEKPQLEYLAARVKELERLTKEICTARIESYLSP